MTDAASADCDGHEARPRLVGQLQAITGGIFILLPFLSSLSGIGLGCATSLGLRAPPCGRTHTHLTKTDAGASAVLHTVLVVGLAYSRVRRPRGAPSHVSDCVRIDTC